MSRMIAEHIDELHAAIRKRYPDGLNYEQFKRVTLESADEDGRVYPPPLAGFGTFQMTLKMGFDKLLEYRGTHHTPFVSNHYITAAGRRAIETEGEAND